MSGVMGIHHVSFLVADVQRSREFYRDILGLEADPARPDLGYPGAWLMTGAQQLHLMQLPVPDPVTDRPTHVGRDRHAAFTVRALEPVVQRLQQSGVDYTRSRSGRRAVFFRDPDGNGVELVEVETT